ncbi:MAG: D-alanine--D-alanine ligase [Clostridia bacterium]|nr:D-alanine--D-alanine ligase [Clostridia bacterium]
MKTKLALFFGGISNEHAISLRSAAAILRALDEERYEIYKIGISREGCWLMTEASPDEIEADRWQAGAFPCLLSPDRALRGLWLFPPGAAIRRVLPDVLFPVMHGAYGEDGRLQGLFSLSGIPYVGSATQAGAIGMDKNVTKILARSMGIPVVPWVSLTGDLLTSPARACEAAEERLSYPMFLKPAHSGSSVGAARVDRRADFADALHIAAAEDDCVLAEAFIPARELEVAVLSTQTGLEVSSPGEILPQADSFYSYEAKYETNAARLSDHAALLPPEEKRIRGYAARLFRALGCRGGARVDFFLSRTTGRIYFNEINTMPGFTTISMFPRLLTKERTMEELLCEMIAGAAV